MLTVGAVEAAHRGTPTLVVDVSSVVVRLALTHVARDMGCTIDPLPAARPYATVTDRIAPTEGHLILVVRDVPAACQEAIDAVTTGLARAVVLWDDPEALRGVFDALARGAALVPHRVIDLAAGTPRLTARQRATLRLLAMGRSNQSIAAAQHQSISTTKRDVADLFELFDVPNRTALLRAAGSLGFV